MPNILKRPMFKLGGTPNSDGVGITSGMQRKNYANGPTTDELMAKMYEQYDASNKALSNIGKKDKFDMAMTFSDVVGRGGSIHDMIMNANEIVRPQYQNYKKVQAQIAPLKFQNLGTMTTASIARDKANKLLDKEYAMGINKQAEIFLDQAKANLKQGETLDQATIAEYESMKIIALGRAFLSMDEARVKALELLQKSEDSLDTADEEEIKRIVGILTGNRYGLAHGGRPGYNMGMGPVMDENIQMSEQIDTPQGDMSMTEDVNIMEQDPGASAEDPYTLLRARLPEEITDDIVRLIAYNPEAFKDFAAIETQEDVINFNKMYQVELVIPAEVQQV